MTMTTLMTILNIICVLSTSWAMWWSFGDWERYRAMHPLPGPNIADPAGIIAGWVSYRVRFGVAWPPGPGMRVRRIMPNQPGHRDVRWRNGQIVQFDGEPFNVLRPQDDDIVNDQIACCGNTKAPEGWHCTRAIGHGGPCAAVPDLPVPPAAFYNRELIDALQLQMDATHLEAMRPRPWIEYVEPREFYVPPTQEQEQGRERQRETLLLPEQCASEVGNKRTD